MAEKFKLQTVLKYRKILEDQAQQRLSELLAAEVRLQQQIDETRMRLGQLGAQLQQKQQAGLTILELRLYEDQIDHYRQQNEHLQIQQNELIQQLNERRQELLIAARERKIIEKLKEKQLAEYLRKMDSRERVMLDEISLRQKGGQR